MNLDLIQDKVDNSANFYDEFLGIDYRLLQYSFEVIKPYFIGSTALEIGPSNGRMTKFLKDEFSTLHILEAAKDLLDKIPNFENVVKFNDLIENFNSDIKYDTIIMSHVLEHISDPILVLKKIHSLLKSNGVFLITVPNAKSLHRLVAVKMNLLEDEYNLNERDLALGHYRVYDLAILKSQLIESGFKIKQAGGYFLKPLSNSQIENNWSNEMIDGFYKVGELFQENCAEIYAVCIK